MAAQTRSAGAGGMEPGLSLRIDFAGGRLGPGKVALLEAVARTGSISAAGRALGMSYRRAWLLIDQVNRLSGETAVLAAAGGTRGGGASLTPFGERLVAAYREAEAAAMRAAGAAFAPLGLSPGRTIEEQEPDAG